MEISLQLIEDFSDLLSSEHIQRRKKKMNNLSELTSQRHKVEELALMTSLTSMV